MKPVEKKAIQFFMLLSMLWVFTACDGTTNFYEGAVPGGGTYEVDGGVALPFAINQVFVNQFQPRTIVTLTGGYFSEQGLFVPVTITLDSPPVPDFIVVDLSNTATELVESANGFSSTSVEGALTYEGIGFDGLDGFLNAEFEDANGNTRSLNNVRFVISNFQSKN